MAVCQADGSVGVLWFRAADVTNTNQTDKETEKFLMDEKTLEKKYEKRIYSF